MAPSLIAHRFSPATWLTAAVLLSAITLVASTGYKMSLPWIGIETTPGVLGAVVDRVDGLSPAQSVLESDVELVSVSSKSSAPIQLTPLMFAGEPDTLVATVTEYRAFIDQQDELFKILNERTLIFTDSDSASYQLAPQVGRPLSSISFDYWFQWFCGIAGLIISVAVFAWRQHDMAAMGFLAMGFGLFLSASSAALYSTREFGMMGDLFHLLAPVNQLGASIYSGGFIVTMLRYPRALVSRTASLIILAIFTLWSILFSVLQVYPQIGTDTAYRLPIVIALATALTTAVIQWRLAAEQPISRASLLWFCAALLLGGFAWGVTQLLPHFLGIGNVTETQGVAFGLLLSVNLGIALGVVRYRLFDLGGWWLSAFSIAIGGAAVLLADVLLVYMLQISQALSLSLALALVGWGYFPVRQWLWKRFSSASDVDPTQKWLEQILSTDSGDKNADLQQLIVKALSPAHIGFVCGPLSSNGSQIVNHGETLLVPINGGRLEASGLAGGKRLATRDDARLCDQLLKLHNQVADYRQGIQAGTKRERERISADLHDDVGARLIRIRGAADSDQKQAINEVLTELRQLSHSLGKHRQPLGEVLADILFEISEQCEIEQVDLDWQANLTPHETRQLDISLCLDWVRIVRELTTNALRYAQPRCVRINTDLQGDVLRVEFTHDGTKPIASPDQWHAGMGIYNLRKRVARREGTIDWFLDGETNSLRSVFTLNLDSDKRHDQ